MTAPPPDPSIVAVLVAGVLAAAVATVLHRRRAWSSPAERHSLLVATAVVALSATAAGRRLHLLDAPLDERLAALGWTAVLAAYAAVLADHLRPPRH